MEHSSKQENDKFIFPDREPPLLTRLGGVPADLVLDSVAQRPESPPFSAAINMVLLSVPQRQPVCVKVL